MLQQKAELLALNAKLVTSKNEQRANIIDQIDALLWRQLKPKHTDERALGIQSVPHVSYSQATMQKVQFCQNNQIAQKLNNYNVFYRPEPYNIKPARQKQQISVKASMFEFESPLSHKQVLREKRALLQRIQKFNDEYEEESQINIDEVQEAISNQISRILTRNSAENIQMQQHLRKIGLLFDGGAEAARGLKCFIYGNYMKVLKSILGILGQYQLSLLNDEILDKKEEALGIKGRQGELLRVLMFLDGIWQQ